MKYLFQKRHQKDSKKFNQNTNQKKMHTTSKTSTVDKNITETTSLVPPLRRMNTTKSCVQVEVMNERMESENSFEKSLGTDALMKTNATFITNSTSVVLCLDSDSRLKSSSRQMSQINSSVRRLIIDLIDLVHMMASNASSTDEEEINTISSEIISSSNMTKDNSKKNKNFLKKGFKCLKSIVWKTTDNENNTNRNNTNKDIKNIENHQKKEKRSLSKTYKEGIHGICNLFTTCFGKRKSKSVQKICQQKKNVFSN